MFEFLEHLFITLVQYSILILETIGAVIIFVAAVRATVWLFRDKEKSKMILWEGIGTALTFLLGGEVLTTIVAPDWKEIGMTCAILIMRAGVTVLLRWESSEGKEELHSSAAAAASHTAGKAQA